MNIGSFDSQVNTETRYTFWGIGDTFYKIYKLISGKVIIDSLIDQNPRGSSYDTIKIYGVEDFFLKELSISNHKIIITSQCCYPEIKQKLEQLGYKENKDFFYYRDWLSYIVYKETGKVVIDKIDLPITLRCTFKCRNCAMLAPYHRNAQDRTINVLKKDINNFFDKVDYVREFMLVGGEPFLHKELNEILEYIGQRYVNKIGEFQIVTNGAVIPTKEILLKCKKYAVRIYISDYTMQIPYVNIMEKLIFLLEKYSIYYKKVKNDAWVDYGDFHNTNNLDGDKLNVLFRKCNTSCRTLFDTKLFYCSRSYSLSLLNKANDLENDYILLNKASKESLLDFTFGDTKLGYLYACKNCNGSFYVNKSLIPVAEQMSEVGINYARD